jgi:hypothetical protein
MDNPKIDGDAVMVQLSKKELIILANAINEAQEAVEEWEFLTRIGASPTEAEDLRRRLKALLSSMT